MESLLSFCFVVLGVLVAVAFIRNFGLGRGRKFRSFRRFPNPGYANQRAHYAKQEPSYASPRPNQIGDASDQLRIVMGASFHKKKIMSKAEYTVFRTIEEHLRIKYRGYRVLSQTSLGEIIGSNDDRAFRAINSKRVDILIIDPFGLAVAAVEYQGDGHYQGDAAARDAVKKEALRKSGIRYVEITEAHLPDDIRRFVTSTIPTTTTQSATGA